MLRPGKIRLGDILVEQGLLTVEQLQFCLDEHRKTGRRLGQVVVDNGIATDEHIGQALAKQLHIPYVNLKNYRLNPNISRLLPELRARRHRAVVLEERDDAFLVGLADPTDLFVHDEIARLLKKDVDLAVVSEEGLFQALNRIYRKGSEISDAARELGQDLGNGPIEFGAVEALSIEDAPVVRLLQSLFEDAVQVGASDIHIEPQAKAVQIRFRMDGVMHFQTEADSKIAPSLSLRLKIMADLDIAEKRLPQDGRFGVSINNQPVDVRLSTMPTQYGESIVMRLLNQAKGMLRLDSIGIPPAMLKRLRQILARPNGLVLVTGPTGSGKTTTLYGALAELNTPERKLITIEDPVEYKLPGINQVQVNEKIELSFARVLRSALRQDPDVVLIGEMRDHETAQVGMQAAMTGHMVFSTLHTNDAISTPDRLLDMEVPRYVMASALQVVIAQRLVRRICQSCSAPYQPTAWELVWLRTELGESAAGHEYKQGTGCSQCSNTGYKGRTGVYEMLEISDEVAEALGKADHVEFHRAAEKQMDGWTLRRHAVQLVLEGKTTVQEGMSVSNQAF
ncbi:GspE/PulE family protein [Lacisediminimonas profundi]|uniref:GspE/PulE family protein n=1 Tax=Lacisediminimonas profundi TaxID=2603856 RepID=UPI00124B9AC4|nr:GspE/PulE family protein [Lacisediminimonas profundi]